jgi:Zn-finger nucleic acid-binding protein
MTPSDQPMTCPKCGAEMRTHRRNGVTIEQCRKCHGIFLDRGELEQLIGRESSFLGREGELTDRGGELSGDTSTDLRPGL